MQNNVTPGLTLLTPGARKNSSFYFVNKPRRNSSLADEDGVVISRPAVKVLNFAPLSDTKARTRTESLIEVNERNAVKDPFAMNNKPEGKSNEVVVKSLWPPVKPTWWSNLVITIVGNQVFNVNTKVEPKTFLANERTFLAWLDMAVTLAGISVAILSMSEKNNSSLVYGLVLLPIAIGFSIYALSLYLTRNSNLRRKVGGVYGNDNGPIAMTSVLCISLLAYFTHALITLYANDDDAV